VDECKRPIRVVALRSMQLVQYAVASHISDFRLHVCLHALGQQCRSSFALWQLLRLIQHLRYSEQHQRFKEE
jgi:hypothetical protein